LPELFPNKLARIPEIPAKLKPLVTPIAEIPTKIVIIVRTKAELDDKSILKGLEMNLPKKEFDDSPPNIKTNMSINNNKIICCLKLSLDAIDYILLLKYLINDEPNKSHIKTNKIMEAIKFCLANSPKKLLLDGMKGTGIRLK